MNNVLQLNFKNLISPDFLPKLKEISPVPFDADETDPNMRDVLTKSEFAEVKKVLVLTFPDGTSRMQFMMNQACRDLFDRHA